MLDNNEVSRQLLTEIYSKANTSFKSQQSFPNETRVKVCLLLLDSDKLDNGYLEYSKTNKISFWKIFLAFKRNRNTYKNS